MRYCTACNSEWPDDIKFCPKDGSATRASRESADFIDSVIADRYRVSEKLGEGGMGAVHLCEHGKMGLEVAITVMADAIARDVEAHDRFTREARNAARIKHHNVCAIHDFGETDLAEAAGETQRAVGALRHYVTLRSDAEPSLAADLERARSDLSGRDTGLLNHDLKIERRMACRRPPVVNS